MRWLLITLALLAAGPASALSCLRPDAVRLFEMARDADESFYIVKGRIVLLEAPNEPKPEAKSPTTTRARVDGRALSQGSFQVPLTRDIQIRRHCLGPWCGGMPDFGLEMLMAIEVTDNRLTLNIGPCGGDLVPWDRNAENRLIACYKTGDCRASEF